MFFPTGFSNLETDESLSAGSAVQQVPLSPTLGDAPTVETRIEDGKLLYERRWFHRGQSVYVEGRDMPKFPANISAIGPEAVSEFPRCT